MGAGMMAPDGAGHASGVAGVRLGSGGSVLYRLREVGICSAIGSGPWGAKRVY